MSDSPWLAGEKLHEELASKRIMDLLDFLQKNYPNMPDDAVDAIYTIGIVLTFLLVKFAKDDKSARTMAKLLCDKIQSDVNKVTK